MQQLLYADEVRSFDDVPIESADVSAKELDLAKLLVEQRAADGFAPETVRGRRAQARPGAHPDRRSKARRSRSRRRRRVAVRSST